MMVKPAAGASDGLSAALPLRSKALRTDRSRNLLHEENPRGTLGLRTPKPLAMFVVSAAAVGVLGLILLSPLFLSRLAGALGVPDWGKLSEIGQTYGAALAVLSAVALGGVAASLFVQAGQAKSQQVQMVREYQRELMRMTLESPELYMPCWRPIGVPGRDLDERRQHFFMTLRMNYAYMGYEVGIINESSLRLDVLDGAFKGKPGREYWNEAQPRWELRARSSRRTRRFVRIVGEEYEKALVTGAPIADRVISDASRITPIGYL